MICTKCSIDKPDTEYASYFHSTQNKIRTRKVCKSCFNEQKKQYKESIRNKKITQPVEDLTPTIEILPPSIEQTNPDYKICSECGELKHLDQYYYHSRKFGTKFANCIECHKKKNKVEQEEYLINNGGHNKILSKPNQYMDDIQKNQTFEVMEILGYTFNEDSGIWTKEGVKTIEDGKIHFHFLKYNKKNLRGKGQKIGQTLRERILFYREKGFTMGQIRLKTGISETSICKILKEYED